MTKEITLLFPGQGAQYVGMGDSLRNLDPTTFEKANEALGFKLSDIMSDGPDDLLKMTENTQPAILTHSISLFNFLKPILIENGITIRNVLGHSVGEYAALVAAESLSFEDAIKAVNLRGKYMQEAVPEGRGKMIALLRIPMETIEKVCLESSRENSEVMPANFNEPGQTVISGDAEACDRVVTWFNENYKEPFKAVELNVSAPFHCSLMKPAAKNLETHFETIQFNPNQIDYIANVDAKAYAKGTSGEVIKKNLVSQVASSVRWTQSIEKLEDNSICLEIGPGKVLMGLVRKINRQVKVIPMDQKDEINRDEIANKILEQYV